MLRCQGVQTDRQTGEHHDSSSTIRSTDASRAKNRCTKVYVVTVQRHSKEDDDDDDDDDD